MLDLHGPRPFPLETLAQTGNWRPQIWHRRESGRHPAGSRSLPTFPRLIVITALSSSAPTASAMRRNVISIFVQQARELRFDRAHSTDRSLRYRARAKDCNHCPRHPRSVPRASKDAASVAVLMKRCWIESEAITRPKLTRRPIANAPSGLNRYSLREKTGMVCGVFACVGTGSVNCEALMIASGQNLKRLLKRRGWRRRPYPAEAVFCFFLAWFGWLTRLFSE
jgi:hypothetical protein